MPRMECKHHIAGRNLKCIQCLGFSFETMQVLNGNLDERPQELLAICQNGLKFLVCAGIQRGNKWRQWLAQVNQPYFAQTNKSEVRMPKRQPRLGRKPARNIEQSVKRTRLFCADLHHVFVHICSDILPIRPMLRLKKLFEAASPIHAEDSWCCPILPKSHFIQLERAHGKRLWNVFVEPGALFCIATRPSVAQTGFAMQWNPGGRRRIGNIFGTVFLQIFAA